VSCLSGEPLHGSERLFFIDLTLTDTAGKTVSRNFYWVPGTLTTFDWPKTNYTHTPALRHEDLTALTSLPQAQVTAHAEIEKTPRGRESGCIWTTPLQRSPSSSPQPPDTICRRPHRASHLVR
jgi:hypothetical protein